MPWFKKGPADRTLIFDTFVAVSRDRPLLVRWPNGSLNDPQRETLGHILANLNTLGRSESWCEAEIVENTESASGPMSRPLQDAAPPDHEIVRLLCPAPESALADDHVVTVTTKTMGSGKKKQTIEERSTLCDPAWNLCMETLQLHKERWSDPPGSRWVSYVRPRTCFKVEPKPRPKPDRPPLHVVRYHVVRYALDSTVLPLVTETLPVAEAARQGFPVNEKRVRRLLRMMGIEAIYPKPRLSSPSADGKKYPYLLRDLVIERPDQVWCTDITYIRMRQGFPVNEKRVRRLLRVMGIEQHAGHRILPCCVGTGVRDFAACDF